MPRDHRPAYRGSMRLAAALAIGAAALISCGGAEGSSATADPSAVTSTETTETTSPATEVPAPSAAATEFAAEWSADLAGHYQATVREQWVEVWQMATSEPDEASGTVVHRAQVDEDAGVTVSLVEDPSTSTITELHFVADPDASDKGLTDRDASRLFGSFAGAAGWVLDPDPTAAEQPEKDRLAVGAFESGQPVEIDGAIWRLQPDPLRLDIVVSAERPIR